MYSMCYIYIHIYVYSIHIIKNQGKAANAKHQNPNTISNPTFIKA